MKIDHSKERGKWFPLVFGLGAIYGFADIFHNPEFSIDGLLHGVGFLMMIPAAFFEPRAFSMTSQEASPPANVWLKGMFLVGALSLALGAAFRWGLL